MITLKSGLQPVYISCRTDLFDVPTIFDFIKMVSFACNLMTFADGKEPLIKTLVDPRIKPMGRYKVDVVGKMIWGWAVVSAPTPYVNFPVLG